MRVLLSLAGGLLGAAIVWSFASRALDAQLARGLDDVGQRLTGGEAQFQRLLAQGRTELSGQLKREINEQVPPLVRRELTRTLSSYGITPETGRRVAVALAAAERAGLLGGSRA